MRTISASEIGEYLYCHRAWWLKHLKGVASANVRELRAGSRAHTRHGLQVWAARLLTGLAVGLLLVAGVWFAWWWFIG